MSIFGSHCKITRAEARALLVPAACKLCVYLTRIFGKVPTNYDGHPCPNCGQPRARGQYERVGQYAVVPSGT